ncbi:hypothetical protein SLS61_003318 [Didymella pomorum]
MYIDTAAANSRSRQPQIVISPRYASQYQESQASLLDEHHNTRDAPPTYLEATTPGLYYGRPSGEEGANLLNGEEQGYKQDEYRRRSFRQRLRTEWTKWLGICMLVVFVLAAGVAFTTSARKDRQPARPDESEGMIAPDIVAIPWPSQSAPAAAPTSAPTSKQIYPIRWPARCGKKYNVKTEEHNFGTSKEVNIKETMHQLDGPYKRIQGWVHITKAPADQAAGTVQARTSYAVSPSIDVDSIKYATTSNSLTIGGAYSTPSIEGLPTGSACLGMSVVLYVAPGATLENLNVEATHLGMQIHGGVNFTVTNTSAISLTSGTLDASMLNSRQTYLKTTSGSISGKYALSDLLVIDTRTGSVNIDVAPKEAAAGAATPAIFRANSQSGSMRVDFERKHIPERDYQTFINTTVGSIDGMFIHGSKTELSSVAGSMMADILPYKSGAFPSTLDTSTHSGQMNVTLRAAYKAKGVSITGLISTHKSVSGGVGLKYPKEWQGHVDGTSLSGELHLQGKELELLSENDEPGKNHVEAKKGDGGSMLVFDTVSGGCDIKIGKM